jgi:hypothetical protein
MGTLSLSTWSAKKQQLMRIRFLLLSLLLMAARLHGSIATSDLISQKPVPSTGFFLTIQLRERHDKSSEDL